jgi:hypothetical protein
MDVDAPTMSTVASHVKSRPTPELPSMLVSREEMQFDFGGARFDIVRDRELLVWIFNQFLYGEVTGIQVGHWLYRAPDLDSAQFLARQAVEELQHVDRIREILDILESPPGPPHTLIRFLSSGMMGDDWAEHVCLEMALGEGLVLAVMYALIETVDHSEIRRILNRAARQEERHVAFGETQTLGRLTERPRLRGRLLGLSLWSLLAVRVLGRQAARRSETDHVVMRQLPAFFDHVYGTAELRLQRLGLIDRPLARLGTLRQTRVMTGAAIGHLARRFWPGGGRLLTRTYLHDRRLSSESTTR